MRHKKNKEEEKMNAVYDTFYCRLCQTKGVFEECACVYDDCEDCGKHALLNEDGHCIECAVSPHPKDDDYGEWS